MIHARPSVRPSVRPFVRDAISGDPRIRFFLNLAQSCILASQKNVPSGFLKKVLVCSPGGGLTQKKTFLAENGLLRLYLRNHTSDFDDFSQMLDIIALNDLASVLCARKFLFAPRGDLRPKMPPFS